MFDKIQLYKTVFEESQLPKSDKPEIILCGRSNVGKSSFINSFFKSSIAKTSSTPGKTRSLNFYLVDDKFFFIDFPGYGFAKTSHIDIANWSRLINYYFEFSRNTIACLHIMDCFTGPTELDIKFVNFITRYQIYLIGLLNKADKANQKEKYQSILKSENYFPYKLNENLFIYSSLKGLGRNEIYKKFKELLIKWNN